MRNFLRPLAMLWLVAIMPVVAEAQTERRIALVIGNESYRNASDLLNPVNDAREMSQSLMDLGFEVDAVEDADYRNMQLALRDFGLKAQEADVALIFFAGHGMQVGNENYLLPVDARLQRERDLLYEALPLEVFMGEVAQAERLGLVILDACRDNPLADNLRRSLGIRAGIVSAGLGRVDDIPSDTLVAYATRPGALAEDGRGANSPYTEALLQHLPEENLELGLFFRRVRDTVLRDTDGRQEPFTYGSLGAEPFYFNKVAPNNDPEIAAIDPLEVLDNAGSVRLSIPSPTDPDDDPLSAEVINLPLNGDVQVGGRSLLIGDQLTMAQLGAVNYLPSGNFAGEAGSFGFIVRDDRDGVIAAAVPITVEASNQPPIVGANRTVTVTPLLLGVEIPEDPDGDPLSVNVLNVPETGTVRLDDTIVQPDDALAAEDLPRLRFDADYGFEGEAGALVLEVTDGRGGRALSTVRVSVEAPSATTPLLIAAAEPPVSEPPAITRAITPASPAEEPEVASLATAPEPTAGSTRSITRRLVARTDSNVRGEPSTSASRVGFLREGEEVVVTGDLAGDGRWWPVRKTDGLEGYVFASLLEEVETPAVRDVPPPPTEPAQVASLGDSPVQAAGGGFSDCPECPPLVALEPGRFAMGSNSGDPSEQPVRSVSIQEPFALGQYEVTVAQWQACVEEGGCSSTTTLDGLAPSHPVRNVSWVDAKDYVAWLNEKTGFDYRLPTEAEWEYAARAGSDDRYWWGDAESAGRANCSDCGGEYDRRAPAIVDALPANPFGLHGMNGGVAEWVEDCWFRDYQGAPADGSARTTDEQLCLRSVLRGGSWRNDQAYVTSSSRQGYDTASRYYANGFRVARDIR